MIRMKIERYKVVRSSRLAVALAALSLLIIFSMQAHALPMPTLVTGNITSGPDPGSIRDINVTISAYRAGTNQSILLDKTEAEVDKDRMMFGSALDVGSSGKLEITIDIRIITRIYRYTGKETILDAEATERSRANVDLERRFRFTREDEDDEDTDSGGGGGGGAPPPDSETTSSMPPITEKDEERADEIRRKYEESEERDRQAREEEESEREEREEEEPYSQDTEERRMENLGRAILVSLTLAIMGATILLKIHKKKEMMYLSSQRKEEKEEKNMSTKNGKEGGGKGKRSKKRPGKKAMLGKLFILIAFLIVISGQADALTPHVVRGNIFGPDKYDAIVNVTLYHPDTGEMITDGIRDGSVLIVPEPREPHPFYAETITLDSDEVTSDEFYQVATAIGNTTGTMGFNETTEIVKLGDATRLNILMSAPLDIILPSDEHINNSVFDIEWDYPNNDWMVFDVEIDTDPSFSSPMRSWEINDTNFTIPNPEELPDDDYHLRIWAKDVSNDTVPVYADYEIISFTVDTIPPEIIDYSPINETWYNEDITFTVETDEPATCRLDTEPGTPFSEKPQTMAGEETSTHMFTTSFSDNGEYDYYIQCQDLAGNIMPFEYHLRYFFDDVHPVTTDDYTHDDTWTTEDASIVLEATDASPSSGIDWTRYCLGEGCEPSEGTDYDEPIELFEGLHYLRYASQDVAGNLEPTNEIIVRIDQTPPETSHDYGYNDTWTDEIAEINLEAEDPEPGSGVDWLRYCLGESCTPDQDYTGTITIDDEGTTYLRYHASDNLGNTESINELIIRIDQTGPLFDSAFVEIDENLIIEGERYAIDTTLGFIFGGFEDDLSGISRYHYAFEDLGTTSNPTEDLEGSLDDAEQGNVEVFVWAEDNVGNLGCAVSDSIIVDTIPPEFIEFEHTAMDSDSVGPLQVNATIIDDTTELDSLPIIRYRYGGGDWSEYYDMTDQGDDVYTFDIPEYEDGWFRFRTQDVHWEINATDIVGNEDTSPLQSEHVDALNYEPYFEPTIENHSVVALGDPLVFWIDAVNPNNDGIEDQELTFESNVTDMNIIKYNNSRALVEWAPDNSWTVDNQDTNNTINFTVTDDGEPPMTGWQLVTIQVNFTVEPPVLEPIGDLSVDENDTLYYQVEAYDPNDFEITFYDNSTLFDIDPVTGEIYYEPDWTEVGEYDINITVGNFEYNVSEVITLEVVNVQNNVTFFPRDSVLERPLDDVTVYGGEVCADGCDFDESLRIVEPIGMHTYTFVKDGFENFTLPNQDIQEDINYTILMDDNEDPELVEDHIILDYYTTGFGDFFVNSSFTISDNFYVSNASLDFVRYEHGTMDIIESDNIELDILEGNDTHKEFGIDIGPFSESFLFRGNVTAYDIHGNSIDIEIIKTHYIYEADAMLVIYPPLVEDIPDMHAPIDETFEYQVEATDFLDRELEFEDDSDLFDISPEGLISFVPSAGDEGEHNITITVSNEDTPIEESFLLFIEEGNVITFEVRDDTINHPIDDVLLVGGRECREGCTFDHTITLIETTDTSEYEFSSEGFRNTSLTFSATSDEHINIYLEDIEPPKTKEINITGRMTEDIAADEFFVDISADISDNVGVLTADFEYEIIESNDSGYVGESGSIELIEENGLYKGTIGPFTSGIKFNSRQVLRDYSGNEKTDENALRHFMFDSAGLNAPHLVITKNTEYLDQELYNVTYRITTEIHNTAGVDIENLQVIDTDISPNYQYFNISAEESVSMEKDKIYDKQAISGHIELTPAAATVFGEDFYSNAPTLLIPGFGGPFDIILYTNETYRLTKPITFDIYLENMNPDYGQDAIVTYWLETEDGEILDLRQESLFVPSESSLEVERDLYPIPRERGEGQYLIKANLTWTRGQQAFATRTFQGIYPEATCDDGIKNQDETDVDCGGSICEPCRDGLRCEEGSDCQSGRCINGICFPATCNDGIRNQGETDVDCGGPCDPCPEGKRCQVDQDCRSGLCEDNICMPFKDHCYDGVQNHGETDVDCGGPCKPCEAGKSCEVDSDCTSLNCAMGICMAATCSDGIQNQGEEDVDCGGPCPPCLHEDERAREPEIEEHYLSSFGRTQITTTGNPMYLSINAHVERDSIMFEELVPARLTIRNNGPRRQEATLVKTFPEEFDVIPIDDDIKVIENQDGHTQIRWEGEFRSKRARHIEFYLTYNEKYRLFFETEESNIKVYNDTFIADDYIIIKGRQRLIEQLDLEKYIDYSSPDNITVTIDLRNTGEIPLRNLTIHELFADDTIRDFWLRDEQLEIPELTVGESHSFSYVTREHEDITSIPVVFGIEPSQVSSKLIMESDIAERAFRFIRFQTFILIALLLILIIYLYNMNLRKNRQHMGIRDSMIKAAHDTKDSLKQGWQNSTAIVKQRVAHVKRKVAQVKNLVPRKN